MKYIGMDVHSRQCTYVVLGKSGRVLDRGSISTGEKELVAFVQSIKGPRSLVFEEGVLAQWLYVLLKDEVDTIVVCQPVGKKGPKTDNIDAQEIADLLRVNRLKSVFHVDNELFFLRTLIAGYENVIRELTRSKNRYKALFRRVAIPSQGQKFYTNEENISLLENENYRFVATNLQKQIQILEEQRVGYVAKFEENTRKYKEIKLLTSIPGIAAIRANQIVGIVVTPHRFPNKYHFFSYAMLTHHNMISDGKLYGKKRAHGQAMLKGIFKTSFFSATASNTAFKRKYDKMVSAGKTERAARNAVAKKIAATVLGVWKSGKKYNDKYKEMTQRQNHSCHNGI